MGDLRQKYELTNPQKSIWLTEKFYSGECVNNLCGTVVINEEVNFDYLKKAINIFVRDNDGFRIRLVLDDSNETMQYIADFNEFNIDVKNLECDNDLSLMQQEMFSIPFKLVDGELYNFKMFKFKDGHGGFVLIAHHLICDGWTSTLLASKIMNIYSSLLKGEEPCEPSTSYIDYINSENTYLSSDKFIKDKEYWDGIFETVPEIGSIPSTKVQTASSAKAARKEFNFSKDEVNRLNDFCKDNKISMFNFFMGVYAIYISRVSGLDDFVLGTPILNRTTFAEKNTPGMFISTVPFRFTIDDNTSFESFAKQIATDSLGMLRHQKYPYQNILEHVRTKNASCPNLYDILISYQNSKTNKNSSSIPFDVIWTFTNNLADNLQIHLFDMNDQGKLNIAYDYRLSKFDDSDICDIHSRICFITEQILNSKDILLKDVQIVTPSEKDLILNKFNETFFNCEFPNSIIEIIEQISISMPDNIAIEDSNSSITYDELVTRINKLANYLIKKNIKEETNIGIFTSRSIDTIVGILAILKLNCTYVPIDPEYPIDRISYMVENSNINYILSDDTDHFSNITDKSYINKISINYDNYQTYTKFFSNTFNYDKNNNLYIIFTSGSTGKPKGVTISHKNMMNLIYFEKNNTCILNNSNAKILQFATMSFDVSYQEIYSALIFGNTLVLIDDTSRKDMNKLSNYIFEKNVDTLFIPPAYLKLLVENEKIRNLLKNNIKNIITAGEVLVITPGMEDLINNNIKIHNHYGPAETHVATTYTIDKNNIFTHPPIGKPIINTNIHILDNNLKLCPIGVVGQIAISGDCVGNGYWNNKNLTNQKFINNPYNNKKTYLTGDLGFFDKNGDVHFVGRSDFQVKLNGFRVELEEIDQVFIKHSKISASVSIIHEQNNKKYIITYFVANSDISENDLYGYLREHLPFYMIPKKIVKLESLPINNNGKIDKKMLPKIDLVDLEEKYIEPKTDTEIKLADIWKKLFNTDKISADYNFFNIGGDSLLAIKLSSIILSTFNVDITVGDIFDKPILFKLASYIDSLTTFKTIEITHCKEADYYPASSAQKRIYYSTKIAGDNSIIYNMPGGVIFDKKPDIEKLENCFNLIINRHSILRTYFDIVDNEIVQKIIPSSSFKFKIDLKDKNDLDSIVKDFVKPFDLSKAPFLRASFASLDDGKFILLFDMHHSISDGMSLSILTTELCKLYNNESLENLEFSYVDYSNYENNILKSEILNDSKEYWINQFKDDIPVLNIPTDFARPAIKCYDGAKIFKILSKDIIEKINNISRELNVSTFMFLLSAYYITLSKYCSQNDIVVGTPVVGRNKKEYLDMIGMFVNTLALKSHIDSNMTFKDYLYTVKNMCINAFDNQLYPFDELINSLNISRDSSRNTLFDTMFIYQNDGYAPLTFDGIDAKYYIPDTKISKFDLSLEIVPTEDKFYLTFEYCTKLFTENTINNFANHYINVLNSIIISYNEKIRNLNILSNDEINIITKDFNNTNLDYNQNKTLYNLIEEQCKKTPNNIAIVFENSSITYKELNEKANQLAHYMKNNLKIGRNSIVGIMLPRSLEVLISIFAVLKTGACYIPIDPSFPKNRIDYMLENSNANLLLCFDSHVDFKNTLCVKLDNENIYSGNTSNLDTINLPEDPSYIIYTSGSTGNPKGVMLNHKALSNLTAYLNNYVDFLKNNHGNMAVASITTISFDIFIFETLICLQKGLKIIMANKDEQVTPILLDELINKHDIKAIQMTPSRMQIFIDNKEQMPNLKNLKYITLAGEALPDKLLADILKLGKITVYNGYGPSETTVFSTFTDVTNYYKINIGKPLSNTQIYILDKDLNICPIGVPGEIYIAGDGVGIGYVNNEEITKERFLTNIFDTNKKFYKTGDLGKYLPNGEISYIGRSDNQIKIRGQRIELDEIESWILKFPDIEKTIVTAKTDEYNRTFLIAYLVVKNRIPLTNLRSYLSNVLPKYMVPSYFVLLDNLPYLPNGKIDKKSLPLPNLSTFNNDNKYIAPNNPLQIKIADAFQKVLGISPISIKDSFFELGGDSLLAMSLQIELMKISNTITYSDIFMYPTVEELSNKINKYLFSSFDDVTLEDFSKINSVLKDATSFDITSKIEIGNILITGVTGFLGAHILDAYLSNNPNGKIYCLIRNEIGLSLEKKLLNKLHFYFNNKYDSLLGKQIIIVNGDISKENLGLSTTDLEMLKQDINIVINCAAKVSHYGDYSSFKEINVNGTSNVIDFCKNYNKKLYHVSTLSVSGNAFASGSYLEQNFEEDIIFKEDNLYINQSLNNVYVRSKFEAEKLVLNAIYNGLDAYILRIGNLMPRIKDLKFQNNINENAYVNRLLTFLKIKIVPSYLLDGYAEFTPIDSCAESIIKLMNYPSNKNRVFHLFNHNHVDVKTLLDVCSKNNKIKILPNDEFVKEINNLLDKPDSNKLLAGILSDLSPDKKLSYESKIKLDSTFTIEYLKNLGFEWPIITKDYLYQFLELILKEG